jgi:DNA-3-methyladenine glycosylase I
VAGFDSRKVEKLLLDPAIVRHRGKIESTINNARRILALWNSGQTFAGVCWEMVGGLPLQNRWRRMSEVPASTPASAQLSKRLKQLGFRFVGETTCYSFLQAAGLVNDHLQSCPQQAQCQLLGQSLSSPASKPASRLASRSTRSRSD